MMIPGASLQLSISQGFARIGIETKPGTYNIQQPPAEVNMEQRPAEVSVKQAPGTLTVDSTEAWAALGSKSVFRMTHDIAEQAHQVALQATQQMSEEGDQLSKPHAASIAQLAVQRMNRGPMPISDFAPASYTPVAVRYTPTPTDITVTPHAPDVQVTTHKPEIQYNRGSVNVYLDHKNWLNIEVKGTYMNQTF